MLSTAERLLAAISNKVPLGQDIDRLIEVIGEPNEIARGWRVCRPVSAMAEFPVDMVAHWFYVRHRLQLTTSFDGRRIVQYAASELSEDFLWDPCLYQDILLPACGVVGDPFANVVNGVACYTRKHGGGLHKCEDDHHTVRTAVIAGNDDRTTVVLPWGFRNCADVAADLSVGLNTTVLSFEMWHNIWTFSIYEGGREIGFFHPRPSEWQEGIPTSRVNVLGEGVTGRVARCLSKIATEAVSDYLVSWEGKNIRQDQNKRVLADDDYCAGDSRQMIDFLRRLGFVWPLDDDTVVAGTAYRLWTKRFPIDQQTATGQCGLLGPKLE